MTNIIEQLQEDRNTVIATYVDMESKKLLEDVFMLDDVAAAIAPFVGKPLVDRHAPNFIENVLEQHLHGGR